MEREIFALSLCQAIFAAWIEFADRHPSETPYAFALIPGQMGHSLGYAIATEEGLVQIAEKYESEGWQYHAAEWEIFENREKFAEWLRWANPDDGWHFGDFPDHFQIPETLNSLVEEQAFGEDAEELEEFCTTVLSEYISEPEWRTFVIGQSVILGVTSGSDPRDFLRTATRINAYDAVRQLWMEIGKAQQVEPQIIPPKTD